MRAIILAAGFGTRMYPLTKNKPKALLKIGKRTLLDYLVEQLEKLPMVKDITLMTNGQFYMDFYRWRKSSRYTKAIYIEDNHVFTPEKKCGAIRDLQLAIHSRKNKNEDYLVLCADNLFEFPLSHFLLPVLSHPTSGFVGLYDVKDKKKASNYGVVQVDKYHQIVEFEEKPVKPKSTKVSVGVYYLPAPFKRRINEYLDKNLPSDKIGDLIGYLNRVEKGNLYGVDFEGAWFDIGSKKSYEEARKYFNAPNR